MALISRVTLRNYKSIASCRVELRTLTFLVGPNGSGKSNFLDGLRFVSEALQTSLDHALRDRGTIKEVRRRSGGHPNHFAIRIDLTLEGGGVGHYSFRVGAKPAGGFEVQNEECKIALVGNALREARFHVQAGRVIESSAPVMPPAVPDRLFLVAAAGLPEFRPVYDALSRMTFYNLNPREIAAMQKPDAGELLAREGWNSASVFAKLPESTRNEIAGYLAKIVPGVSGVDAKVLGAQETLEFRQGVKGQEHPWRFLAASMSDGTLRAFGVLLALFQGVGRNGKAPPLVGLEEPEVALHPAAAGVLLGALRTASRVSQVVVTSHSPDLLDDPNIPDESILAVENRDGITIIGPVDEAGRSVLRDRPFTVGELLRQAQLAPAPESFEEVDERQLKLFEFGR
ncbi:MAG TPA: AAA family ATPase [Verrucomicrobiota bacterium]|nr:chromosome segregation protein SMC [Verrucomicrobiales bacterium]HRI15326.1 AAA family ATPase [Verrucomicrobiota bacterium]